MLQEGPLVQASSKTELLVNETCSLQTRLGSVSGILSQDNQCVFEASVEMLGRHVFGISRLAKEHSVESLTLTSRGCAR